MGAELARNDPCWCGSGKKFKHCHLNRHEQAPVTKQEILEGIKSSFGKRTCLGDPKGSPCSGKVIQAHTVSKKQSLAQIARDGKVYRISSDSLAIGGKLEAKLTGLNQASTFTGFCAGHDAELFKAIDQGFVGTPVQVTLLAYRIAAMEYYKKVAQKADIPNLRAQDRGLPLAVQREIQAQIDHHAVTTEAGWRDAQAHYEGFCDLLRSGNSPHQLVIEFDHPPGVMAAGAFYPEFDLDGSMLQDISEPKPLSVVTFSCMASDGGRGAFVLAWLPQYDAVAQLLAESILRCTKDELPSALLHIMFGSCENLFISPHWWEGLEGVNRSLLKAKMREATDPATPVKCLWRPPRVRLPTNWSVVKP